MCFKSVCALVWNADNAMMHMHSCTTGDFHTAWFGQNKIATALETSLECAERRNLSAARKPSVCGTGSDAILTGFREMRDIRAVRMCDSGAKPNISGLFCLSVVVKLPERTGSAREPEV